jgi:putative hydrolase
MKLTADYHTHTVFSHGIGSIEDNVKAAIDAGLETISITDHSIGHVLYGVKKSKLGDYINEIDRVKRKYENTIAVRAGLELNIIGLDGSIDMPENCKLDTVILGYHKAAMCRNVKTAWTFFAGKDVEKITQSYVLAIQKGGIDIISHPGYGVPVDYTKLAAACGDYGTLFEINEKHTDLRVEDISKLDAKFVVSSDAHSPGSVGKVPNALLLIEKAGLDINRVVNVQED